MTKLNTLNNTLKKTGIINNSNMDPNKILPMRYTWARQHYKDGIANNWTPEEIGMQQDVEQWKSTTVLSDLNADLFYGTWLFCNCRIINGK